MCMRTTVDIADEVFRRAKKTAAERGVPLRQVIEEALREYLGSGSRSGEYRLRWSTEHGRLQPGVRLDDRDALFDLMDGRE